MNTTQSQPLLHSFLFDPNSYMYLVVSLSGELTIEELVSAVEKAYTQNETTMSRLVLEQGKVWFEKMEKTGCKVFVKQGSWQEIRKENERKPFHLEEGEFFRTFLLKEKKGYTLMMMVHHLAADGKGMLLVLEDIFSNLTGEEVSYKPLHNEGSEIIPKDRKISFFMTCFIKFLNYFWKKSGKVFTWEDYYLVHEKFWETRETEVKFETIEKQTLDQIKKECAKLGITVNAYMIARLLKKHPEYKNIAFPISLRKENRSICNRVLMVKPPYRYNRRKSFQENAKDLYRMAKLYQEDEKKRYEISLRVRWMEPTLLDSCLLHTFCGYRNKASEILSNLIGYRGKRKTHLTVTNLTVIPLKQDYGKFQVRKVAGIAPTMSACKEVICIGTFADEMTIAYTSVIQNKNFLSIR